LWPAEYRPESAWKSEHLLVSPLWSAGWGWQGILPANKYLPIYLATSYDWKRISSPPKFDEQGNRVAPLPPPGELVYWWDVPRQYSPYKDEMPYEPKQYGAWPASKVTMSDDLLGIWPGPKRVPPFGYIKIRMPGPPAISGEQNPKGNQIAFMNMRIHTRYMSPDEMKVKVALTPLGPRYYFQSEGWDKYEFDFKQFQRALRARRRKRLEQMLVEESLGIMARLNQLRICFSELQGRVPSALKARHFFVVVTCT
jgi:hypothetical protein